MYNKWGKFFEFTYGGIQVEILKVSSRSVPNSVAGAVSGVIRDSGAVEVQAVGAGAANQAIKGYSDRKGLSCTIGH